MRDSTVTLASNNAYWQARYYDALGRRRAKSLGHKTKLSRRQAKVMCDRLAAELQLSPAKACAGPAPRLGDYVDQYLADRTDLKPASKYLLELTGRYLKQYFGVDTRVDRITRSSASGWRAALARGELKAARKNHQYENMTETSVCRRAGDAKVIFNQAVRDDLLPFNPFDRLKSKAPEPDKDWYYLGMADFDKLIAACPSEPWKLLIALCRLAGLRRGEALALTWAGVDLQERRLRVIATKTGRRRIVPIEPKLYSMLRDAREQVEGLTERVADVNQHCVWRNFRVIRKKAGLPDWDDAFQVMRRNCETDWAQRYPQYAVSTWIGHDITVSAQHYLQVPEELYRKVSAGKPAAA